MLGRAAGRVLFYLFIGNFVAITHKRKSQIWLQVEEGNRKKHEKIWLQNFGKFRQKQPPPPPLQKSNNNNKLKCF
jgi:hypothetical protein